MKARCIEVITIFLKKILTVRKIEVLHSKIKPVLTLKFDN